MLDSLLKPGLDDQMSNGEDELDDVTLGSGFKGVTDIETGPDDYYSHYIVRLFIDISPCQLHNDSICIK